MTTSPDNFRIAPTPPLTDRHGTVWQIDGFGWVYRNAVKTNGHALQIVLAHYPTPTSPLEVFCQSPKPGNDWYLWVGPIWKFISDNEWTNLGKIDPVQL